MRAPSLALLALLLAPSLALAAEPDEGGGDAVARALAWLASLPASERGYATNVVEAASQAGLDPRAWPSGGQSAFDELAPYGGVDGDHYSHLRVAHAAGTSGYDPRDVHGVDYVALAREAFDGAQSGSPEFVNDDAWAILALRGAGVPRDDAQVRASALALRAAQLADGGWSYRTVATRSATDVTGAAIAALRAAGEPAGSATMARARLFLDSTYDEATGGHVDNLGIGPNCQSTAWAIHGYAALGAPERAESHAFLARLQHPEGGIATGFDARGARKSPDAFCTAEAIPVLAGARYPFASYARPELELPRARAREAATIPVPAPFATLEVRWHDPAVAGGTTFVAPRGGVYGFELLARGEGILARGTVLAEVLAARPSIGAFPPNVTVHRPAALALDLANVSDPDRAIERFEVDWGDGNVSEATRHAYAVPGEYVVRVRALDDAGEWTPERSFRAIVPNRPPEIAPLPARIVGDRVAGARVAAIASDPDGDPVERVGAETFHGALGAHRVPVVFRDAYGAEARAEAIVEIQNLPPEIAARAPDDVVAGETIELEADARDPDGPAPRVEWSVGPRARFEAGEHAVTVAAVDADGARVVTTLRFRAREPESAPDAAAPVPAVRSLEATLEAQLLTVVFDADGYATLRWASDGGDGERRNARSPFSIELPGASWASVSLEVASGPASAARQASARVLDAKDAPAPLARASLDAEPIVVEPAAPSPNAEGGAASPPTEIRDPPLAESAQTPAPAAWLAIGAALLARRGRRAA